MKKTLVIMERLNHKITTDDIRLFSKVQFSKFGATYNLTDKKLYPIREFKEIYRVEFHPVSKGGSICVLETHITREVNSDYSPKSQWEHMGDEGQSLTIPQFCKIINSLLKRGEEVFVERYIPSKTTVDKLSTTE